jgi:hypothetical protein
MMAVTELPDHRAKWVHQAYPVAMDLRDRRENPVHPAQVPRESKVRKARVDYLDQLAHQAILAETESPARLVGQESREMLDTKDQPGRWEQTARQAPMATQEKMAE